MLHHCQIAFCIWIPPPLYWPWLHSTWQRHLRSYFRLFCSCQQFPSIKLLTENTLLLLLVRQHLQNNLLHFTTKFHPCHIDHGPNQLCKGIQDHIKVFIYLSTISTSSSVVASTDCKLLTDNPLLVLSLLIDITKMSQQPAGWRQKIIWMPTMLDWKGCHDLSVHYFIVVVHQSESGEIGVWWTHVMKFTPQQQECVNRQSITSSHKTSFHCLSFSKNDHFFHHRF